MALTQRPWGSLTGAYLIAFGFMVLLGNARFWDDWTSHSFDGVEFMSGQLFPFREFMDEWLISVTGGFWMYRPLTIAGFLFSGWCLSQILKVPRNYLNDEERIWIVALFLLLPLNSVRAIVQGLFSYTFSHTVFYLAWYLFVAKRSVIALAASLVLFGLAFPTHSLLFFAIVPATHCLLQSEFTTSSRLLRVGMLGILSLTYRSLSNLIWPTLQLNPGYNVIRASFLSRSMIFMVGLATIAAVVVLRCQSRQDFSSRKASVLTALGLLSFGAGAFPYMAVGHLSNISDFLALFVPNLTKMHSRHSLLLALGLSLIAVGSVNQLIRESYRHIALGSMVAVCIILNVSIYSQYYVDHLKQRAITEALSERENQIRTNAVQFKDLALDLNARGRDIYPWEYLGMLGEAGQGVDYEVMDLDRYPCQDSERVLGTHVTIYADSGRLYTILSGNPRIRLRLEQSFLCGPGITAPAALRIGN